MNTDALHPQEAHEVNMPNKQGYKYIMAHIRLFVFIKVL
jgi:hypothetical protein